MGEIRRHDIDIIGTHLRLLVESEKNMEECFSEIDTLLFRFEKKYSRFLSDNWLAGLNQDRHAVLDSDGKTMLHFMLEIARVTGGYFDPTVGKRLAELGYGNTAGSHLPYQEYHTSGDYRDIEIVGESVTLGRAVELEFGGVGKGYLIQEIRSIVERQISGEKSRFLIDFGGDLYGRGKWRVGLESPFALDEIIGSGELEDIYLACSSGSKRRWGDSHHLIDPHTGQPAREVVASYIEVDGRQIHGGMISDAYATALCVMPWDLACATLEKTPEISGVIVHVSGISYKKDGTSLELFV